MGRGSSSSSLLRLRILAPKRHPPVQASPGELRRVKGRTLFEGACLRWRPPGCRPGSRLTFLLVQESKQRSTARTALAPRLRQGVPGFATKAGVGQKLPAFALLTSVRQSARASSRSALSRAPLPWPQARRRRGANTVQPAAKPSYPLAACTPPLEIRLFGCWLLGARPFCAAGSGAKARARAAGTPPLKLGQTV